MRTTPRHHHPRSPRSPRSRGIRAVAASAAVVTGLTGLAACSESGGPEQGAVTTEDLQELEDSVADLESRVAGLEGTPEATGTADGSGEDSDDEALFGGDPDALVGDEVTVSAAVSDVVAEDGSVFRMAGGFGEPVTVIFADASTELALDDVVEVTGTVTVMQRESFEEDFGVDPETFFDDPDAWFEDAEGEVAVAATSVEVIDADLTDATDEEVAESEETEG